MRWRCASRRKKEGQGLCPWTPLGPYGPRPQLFLSLAIANIKKQSEIIILSKCRVQGRLRPWWGPGAKPLAAGGKSPTRTNVASCRWACAAILLANAAAAKVVSLNLCTDQLLLLLAPEQIAALSPLARDPALSTMAEAARAYPMVRPEAEAVLRLHPDLVLAGDYGAGATLAALAAAGTRVERVPEPTDFPGIARLVRRVAALLGMPRRAEAPIAAMWARLAARPAWRRQPSAIIWQAHGFTSGPGTLGDAVLRAAGFRNAAAGRAIGVERMAADPPDILILEQAPATPSLATDMLRHPAVRLIPHRTIPPALLTCGLPATAAALDYLR